MTREDIQELVQVWLSREGLEFFSCSDGLEGQATAARSPA